MNILANSFWLMMQSLQLALLAVLLLRPGRKRYPAFTAYILFCALRSALLFGLHRESFTHAYYVAYWTGTLIGSLLILAILYSIFVEIFPPMRYLPPLLRMEMRLYFCVSLLLGILVGNVLSHINPGMVAAIETIDRMVDVAKFLLCGSLLLFASNLGIPWQKRLFGMSIGIWFNTATRLACSVITSYSLFHWSHPLIEVTLSLSYCISLGIWIAYFAAPEQDPVPVYTRQGLRIGGFPQEREAVNRGRRSTDILD